MYVRKKKNRSGTISVVVVSKSSGKYREIQCFGTVASEEKAEILYADAQKWIKSGKLTKQQVNRRGYNKSLERNSCLHLFHCQ